MKAASECEWGVMTTGQPASPRVVSQDRDELTEAAQTALKLS